MKILIIAIGKIATKSPEDILIQEYLKRIPWKVEVKQLEAEEDLKKTTEKMMKAIPAGYTAVLLDSRGKSYSSEEFAAYVSGLGSIGTNKVAFLIGGAEGFHKEIYGVIKNSISFGKMTYAHKLVRVMLAEQLYRAWAIAANHPYHK
jgi:23S rRNA (pseudouridine1915-N3)-methyltransferase